MQVFPTKLFINSFRDKTSTRNVARKKSSSSQCMYSTYPYSPQLIPGCTIQSTFYHPHPYHNSSNAYFCMIEISMPPAYKPSEEHMLATRQDSTSNMLPRTPWFSKGNLDTLRHLLTSMTLYRPLDRLFAVEVLKHACFSSTESLWLQSMVVLGKKQK